MHILIVRPIDRRYLEGRQKEIEKDADRQVADQTIFPFYNSENKETQR